MAWGAGRVKSAIDGSARIRADFARSERDRRGAIARPVHASLLLIARAMDVTLGLPSAQD